MRYIFCFFIIRECTGFGLSQDVILELFLFIFRVKDIFVLVFRS